MKSRIFAEFCILMDEFENFKPLNPDSLPTEAATHPNLRGLPSLVLTP